MGNVFKEYSCPKCGHIEIYQHHSKQSKKCPECSSPIERLISKPIVAKDGGPRTVGSQIELNNKRNPLTREKVFGVGAEKKIKEQERLKKIAKLDSPEKVKKFVEDGTL